MSAGMTRRTEEKRQMKVATKRRNGEEKKGRKCIGAMVVWSHRYPAELRDHPRSVDAVQVVSNSVEAPSFPHPSSFLLVPKLYRLSPPPTRAVCCVRVRATAAIKLPYNIAPTIISRQLDREEIYVCLT